MTRGALGIVDRLIESAQPEGAVVPCLWHLRGEALAGLGRLPESIDALEAARDATAEQGLKPQLWRTAEALGRLYRRSRRHTEAQRTFSVARATVEDLVARMSDGALASQFRERALAPLPPSRPPTPREALRQAYGGLTGRERDVALRIARGMTNRAIADEIVVSERTVEGYVENVLAKLGFESRSQVAAWAVEVGLSHGV